MKQHPARLIAKKRDGGELTDEEIRDLILGVTDGSLGDAQLGAFLMAVCLVGMTPRETAALTLAMRDSGTVLSFPGIRKPKIDKHSTGGVGDKVSLLLSPLVAAAGIAVPMISGRGLGHTGGTVDKLGSIPGYRMQLTPDEVAHLLAECGYAMTAATGAIAPADRRMYATRDVTATVESVPLITASILSKKLAAGIDGLVMDVKQGRAAFLKRPEDAVLLRDSLVAVGKAAGLAMSAWITDMDHPLGRALGNALEVREVIDALDGRGPKDLLEITLELGADMVVLGGIRRERGAARELLETLLAQGTVRQLFRRNVELQGGDPRIVDEPDRLGHARQVQPALAAAAGFVEDIDPLRLGNAIVDLGGGRRQPQDAIDPHVGIVLAKEVGDAVTMGETLAWVHAGSEGAAAAALAQVHAAIRIGPARHRRRPLVLAAPS